MTCSVWGGGSSSALGPTAGRLGHIGLRLPAQQHWPCPQIVRRYDIILIQEVRDSHLVAVGKLLDDLNQWVKWGPRIS